MARAFLYGIGTGAHQSCGTIIALTCLHTCPRFRKKQVRKDPSRHFLRDKTVERICTSCLFIDSAPLPLCNAESYVASAVVPHLGIHQLYDIFTTCTAMGPSLAFLYVFCPRWKRRGVFLSRIPLQAVNSSMTMCYFPTWPPSLPLFFFARAFLRPQPCNGPTLTRLGHRNPPQLPQSRSC